MTNSLQGEERINPRCGYCKNTRHGVTGLNQYECFFISTKMRIDDYEKLQQYGFTRSGNYFYKKHVQKGCCEIYQYRVDTEQYAPNAQQRKAMKRFYRYLMEGRREGGVQQVCAASIKECAVDSKEEKKEERQVEIELKGWLERQGVANWSKIKVQNNGRKYEWQRTNVVQIVKQQSMVEKCVEYLQSLRLEVKIEGNFLLIKSQFQQDQPLPKKSIHLQQVEERKEEIIPHDNFPLDPNYFTHYVKSFIPFETKGKKPKHKYTIEMHRCKYTEELEELSTKYEIAVHQRQETGRDFVQGFLCDNPLYNPDNVEEAKIPSYPSHIVGIDGHRVFKDEGIYPGVGGYHMYHRIDGKLIAVGYVDITSQSFDSGYFIYDPDYRFLNIGVVGAIIEIEYMRLVRQQFNPNLRYYVLGDLNIACSKVNYKLNYQPGGEILCPTTLQWIPVDKALPTIQAIQTLTIEEKKELPSLKLSPDEHAGKPAELNIDPQLLQLLHSIPVVYNGQQARPIGQLYVEPRSKIEGLQGILKEIGPDLFSKFVFEHKDQ
ncbi:hypothetical protein FGO68_gene6895 [Halteria grandinella]|uniref:Arginyl-tRNA--protein transferase 1 n=1 Tax=Halteria grandinella TaxID=5974 RepID=A0A8J8T3S7_HALGN|nr:hypothetical protein FGO68_gene6895 [Halteria grandinella]